MKDFINDRKFSDGSVKIANDIIIIVAGLAATEIEGVVELSGNLTSDLLGKKNSSKGIKIDVTDNEITIDLFLIVEYNVNIVNVAKAVQENVKKNLETMTGLKVKEVNIFVEGVNLKKTPKI